MRLDRYIANATGLSRSQVHRALKNGEALLNGAPARSNAAVNAADSVTLLGEPVEPAKHVYLALHKPQGFICATEDAEHATVLDLVTDSELAYHPTEALQIVGRLDIDTTGLVLLTTDGQWNHRITSPKGQCRKTYEVTLAAPISAADITQLEQGIMLRSETKPTRPCRIVQHSATAVSIELNEGKYHQVKRMFAAVGNRVVTLHRSAVGAIVLDASLDEGQLRALTAAEIDAVR